MCAGAMQVCGSRGGGGGSGAGGSGGGCTSLSRAPLSDKPLQPLQSPVELQRDGGVEFAVAAPAAAHAQHAPKQRTRAAREKTSAQTEWPLQS
eukprot:3506420-Pleurochrysis_carterae.AAC.2